MVILRVASGNYIDCPWDFGTFPQSFSVSLEIIWDSGQGWKFDGLRTRVLVCLSAFDVARAQESIVSNK